MSIFGKLAGFIPGGQVVTAGEFIVDHWKEIVAVLLVITSVIFWALWRSSKADLVSFQAKVQTERAQQELEDAEDQAASVEYIINLDRDHDQRVETLNRTWTALLDSVRNESSSKPPSKPVPTSAKVCADEAGNSRLSDAVDSFRSDVRTIIDAERSAARASRAEASRLLAVCHRQAGDLAEVVQWAEHEEALWGEDGKSPLLLQ